MRRYLHDHFLCRDFGFPIWMDRRTPKDNIEKKVILSLCWRPFPLLGREVAFIRHFLGLSIRIFAQKFDVSIFSVSNWEYRDDKIAKIPKSIEKEMRIYIAEILGEEEKPYTKKFKNFKKDDKCRLISLFHVTDNSMWIIWLMKAHKLTCLMRHKI
jgi:hypothetical protein